MVTHLPANAAPLWIVLTAALSGIACGENAPPSVIESWMVLTDGDTAPPGIGVDRRVLIAQRGTMGKIQTVEEASGRNVEGPFDTFPTAHAPIMIGADLFIVTSIGNIVGLDLAGVTKVNTQAALGRTSPLVAADDGTLRVASTTGRLFAMRVDGTTIFDTMFTGAVQTAPAVGADGSTYVATDTGALLGFDSNGAERFNQSVNAPASGPSVFGDRIAVGELDGVSVFNADGSLVFRVSRAARVIGTRLLPDGRLIAWGEDGLLELYDESGGLVFSYNAGPPIQANVLPLSDEDGGFAVFGSDGLAHRVSLQGERVSTLMLDAPPQPQVVAGSLGLIYAAVGQEVIALNFNVRL